MISQYTWHYYSVVAVLAARVLQAAVLPDVIGTNAVYAADTYVVSNALHISPHASVWFAGAATVLFVQAEGAIQVHGSLYADRVLFVGENDGPWGRILVRPGATCALYNCTLLHGGGTALPPPMYSNAVVLAHDAAVVISNTAIVEPHGDGCAFFGGNIVFMDSVSPAVSPSYGLYAGVALYGGGTQPTVWRSSGNTLAGLRGGIWVQGVFDRGLDLRPASNEVIHLANVIISNASFTLVPGSIIAVDDILPGGLIMAESSILLSEGTPAAPILWTNYHGQNPWAGMTWLSGSTGLLASTVITRAMRHTMSNAYVSLTHVKLPHLQGGWHITDHAMLVGEDVLFHGMVNQGIVATLGSSIRLRQGQFIGNNTPFIPSVSADETSLVDARFCWWNAANGPWPFGSGERVETNANSMFFPWLLAAPGSQTNPPVVEITSPATEPTVTSDPQIWLAGNVHDDGQIVSVVVQNASSTQRVLVTPDAEGAWRAQIWLYEGMNALAVFAYDEQGNAAVDARLVECRGAGVGAGAARPPVFAPMPNRKVRVGELVRARCVATSPDSCVLTYWAVNVPPGGSFDQELRELRFIPTQAGIAYVIEFFACDGKNVATTTMTVDVVGNDPPVGIRTKALPRGYRFHPYTYTLIADNAVGPVTWSFSDVKPQDGLVFSRAGILAGVPLKGGTVNFIAIARDARGGAAASNLFALEISDDQPASGIWIPFQQVPVCVSGTPYSALMVLTATNGVPAYAWHDAADALSDVGMALSSNGVLTGVPTKPGVHGWLPVVRDQSNATAYAELALPVIAPEHRLQRMAGLTKAKLLINRVSGSQHKGALALKIRFTPPPGFTFDQKSPVVAQIGLTQITVPNPFKYTPGAQLVFKKVDGMKSTSISIKYKPGIVQASFAMKKVNLNFDFEQYGIYNENVLAPRTAQIPVWVRIGNYEMATELMPLQFVTKVNKSTKGKAAW